MFTLLYVTARLRRPFRLLECPDWASLPASEDCSGHRAIPPQRLAPVSDAFPMGVRFHLLETGLQVIRLSPYRADLPAHHPWHLGMVAGFLRRGRLPGEVPFLALFPGSPLPNPPCASPIQAVPVRACQGQ